MAWRLFARFQERMAVFVLILASCYLCSSNLLRLKLKDTSPQVWLLGGLCCCVARRQLRRQRLGNPETPFPWMSSTHGDEKNQNRKNRWNFDDGHLQTEHLGINLTAYRTSHRGPSQRVRIWTLAQIQQRGRWAVGSSVRRYKRHARMAAEWEKPTDKQRQKRGFQHFL